MGSEAIAADLELDASLVEYVQRLIERSEHMRAAPSSAGTRPSLP